MAWTWIAVIVTLACLTSGTQADCSDDVPFLIHVPIQEGRGAGFLWNFTYDVQFVSENKDVSDMFNISNGSLYLKQDFHLDGKDNKDRCRFVERGMDFDIKCNDVANPVPKTVVVNVNRTDDYPPMFAKGSYTVQIPEENVEPVSVFQLKEGDNVYDEDCGANLFQYNVESSQDIQQDAFGIRGVQPEGKEVFASLTLDYDVQKEYNLTISVTSQESAKKGFTTLIVEVVDVDDKDPIFDTPTFDITVDEETDLSTNWLHSTPKIHAYDGDTGINQPMVYSIVDPDPGLQLEIDSTSGGIKIHSVLDRETNSTYQVMVEAAQSDNAHKSARALLTIHVRDVNDHVPQFSHLNHNVTLQWDALDGTWILPLHVTDGDIGDNAKNTLSIVSDHSGAFGLVQPNNDGITWLVVNNTDELMRIATTRVTIRATPTTSLAENVTPCDYTITCVTHVSVTVLDKNRQRPIFQESSYPFKVYKSQIDLSVGHISVVNQTSDTGPQVKFSTLQFQNAECKDVFEINEASGEITMVKDLYQPRLCPFQVKACFMENNSNRLCSTVPVIITVLTMKTRYDLHLVENAPVGTELLRLPERKLELNNDAFELKSNYLVTKDTLDRETNEAYNLSLTDDNGLVSTVHIQVDDINDNAPIPEESVYNALLTGLEKVGKELITVKATDADIGSNGDVSYFLLNDHDWLSIGQKSGIVTLTKTSSHEYAGGMQQVFVSIQDNGSPPMKTIVKLQVSFPSVGNNTATLVLTIASEKVRKDITKIQDKLTSIIDQTVTIVKVDPLGDVNDVGSILSLTARYEDGKEIPPGDLKKLLKQHAREIHDHFHEEEEDTKEEDDVNKILFIVFICLCAVLLVVIILTCRHYRTRNKQNIQKMSIMATLNRDTKIYDDTGNDDDFIQNGGSSKSKSNGISSNGPNASSCEFENLAFVPDYENMESSSDTYAKIIRNGSIKNVKQNDWPPVTINISSATSDSSMDDNWVLEPSTSVEMKEEPESNSNEIQEDNSTTQKPYVSTVIIVKPQNKSSGATDKNIPSLSNDKENSDVAPSNSQDGDTRLDGDEAPSNKTTPEHDPSLPAVSDPGKMPTEPRPDYSDSPDVEESHHDEAPVATVGVKDNDSASTDQNCVHPHMFSFTDTEGTLL